MKKLTRVDLNLTIRGNSFHTQTFGSQVKKRVPPKRSTGPRRCVYTNPHIHTTTSTGPRASNEDQRNTQTRTYEAPKS